MFKYRRRSGIKKKKSHICNRVAKLKFTYDDMTNNKSPIW